MHHSPRWQLKAKPVEGRENQAPKREPISANRASTGPLIPPLFVYVMMIPSAITSNPLAGNILIALCNVAAVLLTYIFVRRYYGRLAGAIAALLYATAVNVIIWPVPSSIEAKTITSPHHGRSKLPHSTSSTAPAPTI